MRTDQYFKAPRRESDNMNAARAERVIMTSRDPQRNMTPGQDRFCVIVGYSLSAQPEKDQRPVNSEYESDGFNTPKPASDWLGGGTASPPPAAAREGPGSADMFDREFMFVHAPEIARKSFFRGVA
jgi:hypothetical protein